jgi:hypothetical protein
MTVSMLRETAASSTRRWRNCCIGWARTPLRQHDAAGQLLIALACRCADRLRVPIACVLQGEDLFLKGIPEPWRTQALDLIRGAVDHVDIFIA